MTEKILIVDDEENICFTLNRFLTDAGYQVSEAYDFKSAVQLIESNSYDLILLDILLDSHSGTDLLQIIKQKTPHCPVVMITGVPTVETASEAVRLGAFDYLPKPVLAPQLLHVTKLALAKKSEQEQKQKYDANLEATIKSVKEGIITFDQDGYVLLANEIVQTVCGFSLCFEQGMHINDLLSQCSGDCLKIINKVIEDKKEQEAEFSCTCGQKHQQSISMVSYPLFGENNRFTGGVLLIKKSARHNQETGKANKRQGFHHIVGQNSKMQQIYNMVEFLCDVKTTVLITGETGTGKELLADAIHRSGENKNTPLVKVNCATISDNLLESELFGHVKGAFSGAIKDKVGRFEVAHQGTIFLDEIGEISPRMQLALLRVLQEREFERVGDTKPIKIDVRVIAATNRDLEKEVQKGNFRKDLYFRLKVVQLYLPPLRKRKDDIKLLIDFFISQFNEEFGKSIKDVSPEVLKLLSRYPWPGNIRELKNVLEHAFILSQTNLISAEHLPHEIAKLKIIDTSASSINKEQIIKVLQNCRYNKSKAAKMLNLSRQSLYRKMKELNITH